MQLATLTEASPKYVASDSKTMVEDTLDDAVGGGTDFSPFVLWKTYSPSKEKALATMPGLANTFAQELTAAGINAKVRFLGMPTSAGLDTNLAHLWIETDSQELTDQVSGFMRQSNAIGEMFSLSDAKAERPLLALNLST